MMTGNIRLPLRREPAQADQHLRRIPGRLCHRVGYREDRCEHQEAVNETIKFLKIYGMFFYVTSPV